ncbi:MAG: alpha/beta fold hydrolase [Proteobacteria bacterium]|nr:alpha/beta fold hydrolase [Pseudomonadota bacterium]
MPWYENRNGESLWYEDGGAGCPVVLVHGWCMSSAVWKYQFGDLSSSVRLLAPDLRGHGRSRGISGNLNFDGFAKDLADLFEYLNLSEVVLLGWSMGAQIALQSYAQLSGRLAGMVLASATPCFTAAEDFPYGLAGKEAAGMRLKVQRNAQRALDGFFTRLFTEEELAENAAASEIRQILLSIPPPETVAVLEALEALAQADMRPLLASIAIPTLIMNGGQDLICLPQASDYLKAHIPGAEQVVFSPCGHAPFLTQSHQFNAELIRFTRSVCGQNA